MIKISNIYMIGECDIKITLVCNDKCYLFEEKINDIINISFDKLINPNSNKTMLYSLQCHQHLGNDLTSITFIIVENKLYAITFLEDGLKDKSKDVVEDKSKDVVEDKSKDVVEDKSKDVVEDKSKDVVEDKLENDLDDENDNLYDENDDLDDDDYFDDYLDYDLKYGLEDSLINPQIKIKNNIIKVFNNKIFKTIKKKKKDLIRKIFKIIKEETYSIKKEKKEYYKLVDKIKTFL